MIRRLGLAAALVLALDGCALFGAEPVPDIRHLPNLFISPSGKPFRGEAEGPYAVAVWFAAADTNHDGKLTLTEFQTDAKAFFRELDTDHDGVIDGFEVQHYEQQIAPEILPHVEGLSAGEGLDLSLGNRGREARIGEGRKGRGGRPAFSGEGASQFGLFNDPEPVASADTAFDSRITLKAFLQVASDRFHILDVKQTGSVTLSDLPTTPLQRLRTRAMKAHTK